VREYSTPILVTIPASASLADVVFRRAQEDPDAVIMRRKDAGQTGSQDAGQAGGQDAGQAGDQDGGQAGDQDGGQARASGEAGAPGWRDVTARQFRDEVVPLAKGLIAAGIAPGDRVGLMSKTRYEWTLIDYAIWAAGAVTVPIYETSSAEQVEWILGDSQARAVFAETAAHENVIGSVRAQLPGLEAVWRIEGEAPGDPPRGDQPRGDQPLGGLADRSGAVGDGEFQARREGVSAGDLATIIYTSGTTGRPKGCELTHANLLADVRNATQGALTELFDMAGGSTLLFLPLAHSFARVIQVGCLESGIVLGHTANISRLAPELQSFRPTFLLAVPRVFEKVYNTAEQQASESPAKSRIFRAAADTAIAWSRALEARDRGAGGPGPALALRHRVFDRLVYARLRAAVGGRVRFAVSGGAALGERLGHFFRGAGITILEGYGMTETSAAGTVNRPSRHKVGSVGLPVPGCSVRIAEDGEILMKGPMVFPGYWHNEAATAEVLDAEGWIRTGDIGSLDDEGFLHITGRKKELIVTAGGKNVSPAVLEDRLRAHPLISQTMVVGDNRPYVAALVTIDEETLPYWRKQHGKAADTPLAELKDDPEFLADIQQAVDDANKAVSRAEAIRRFRVLDGDFTEAGGQLTPSLKLRRGVVAKECAADIDALYSS
jgi:long-chain acyl-CoA synthetase